MTKTKLKAPVLVGSCIILMMVFASNAVYGGDNPPPVGTLYMGPAVLVDLTFRQADETEQEENDCCYEVNGEEVCGDLVIAGEAECKGQTFPIRDYDPPNEVESFEFCAERDFANTTEEWLNDFWVKEVHIPWLLEVLPPNCRANISMVDWKGLVINVVTHYSEDLNGTPPTKSAKGVMLFLRPSKK